MARFQLRRPPLVPALLGGLALLMVTQLALFSCGGSQRPANDDAWSTEADAAAAHPLRGVQQLAAEEASPTPTAAKETAMVGVRPDLSVAKSAPRAESCSCLVVQAGPPGSSNFAWQNGSPKTEPGVLAVAVDAQGVSCEGGPPEANRHPSISAVDRQSGDVIIEIEELKAGRPLAPGALVPAPAAGRSIYVRPKSKSLPYAKPDAQGALCKVYTSGS